MFDNRSARAPIPSGILLADADHQHQRQRYVGCAAQAVVCVERRGWDIGEVGIGKLCSVVINRYVYLKLSCHPTTISQGGLSPCGPSSSRWTPPPRTAPRQGKWGPKLAAPPMPAPNMSIVHTAPACQQTSKGSVVVQFLFACCCCCYSWDSYWKP